MSTVSELLTVPDRSDRRRRAQIDIVIPVYNEAEGLAASIRRLHAYLEDRFPLTWRITIADNASVDHTWGIACRLANELDGVEAAHLDQKGRGRALRAAWSSSDAPVVAYMDVDLSTDLDALLPLVAPLLSGHSDVAIGSRLAPGARVVRGPKREAISRSYNLILKAALRSGFSDAQCGFKAVRTDVARTLLPLIEDQGWFFDTELLVLAEHNGLRIHEVPVDWVDDPDSRVNVVATAKADLRGVWRMLRRTATGDASIAGNPRAGDARLNPSLASQLVRFASIGLVSSVLFAVLFALTAPRVGSMLAAVVSLAVCTVANTAANRRLTFSLRGRASLARHHLAALGLAVLPLALIVVTLLALGAAGVTSLVDLVVALTFVNWTASTLRFIALRRWVFRRSSVTDRSAVGRRFRQLVRYGSVSAISTTVSLIVLGALVSTSALPAAWANVVATCVGIVPSFELNRRWVWSKQGKRSLGGEVIPFVILSFAGLGLSTVAVAVTAQWATNLGLESTARTVAVELANLAAFGTLWIAQFVILDKVLFRHHDALDPASATIDDLDEDVRRHPSFATADDGVAA
jgi:putative flippase GtrA/glycosyltransferase involved in cell wall biosynthesis